MTSNNNIVWDGQSFLRVSNIAINDKIKVHIPKVGEILDYGERKYYSCVQSLTAKPFDLIAELDDLHIDYEEITPFELFCGMFQSIAYNENDTAILFNDLDMRKFKEMRNTTSGELMLFDKENDIVIDEIVAYEIADVFRKMHFWKETMTKSGNAEGKQFRIERAKRKRERLRRKPYKSFFENSIISLVNTHEFKYDYESVMNISVYQFNASVMQISKLKDWNNLMDGVYAGTVDTKKLNLEKWHWLNTG